MMHFSVPVETGSFSNEGDERMRKVIKEIFDTEDSKGKENV
jgi:hypothetical protein